MNGKPIRIFHILEGFVGGTSTYVCSVLPLLVQRGFDVILICSLNRCSPDALSRIAKLRQGGVKVQIIPMYREVAPLRDVRSFATIVTLLLKYRPDIVHTHCSKGGALGRTATLLFGKCAKVHTPHCFAFLRNGSRHKRFLYRIIERLLGKVTTKLIAVSQSEAAVAIRSGIVPADRCVCIRNGLSANPLPSSDASTGKDLVSKASIGIGKKTRVITTACRLVDYKGVFRFLRAAKISRASDAVFLLGGHGKLRASAERFIGENGLIQKVKLLGYVANMDRLYAISDVIVLSSDAEAQPYLLLEAMRAKRPIVATAVIGNKELISHGNTGYLAEPTPASIAMAIDELLADREKRDEYAERAYVYFCKYHQLERQISELTTIYESSVSNGQWH